MVEPLHTTVNRKSSISRDNRLDRGDPGGSGAKHRPRRIIALAAMLALCLIWSGCVGPSPTPPPPHISGLNDYIAGAQAYDAGDTERATALLQDAVEANPQLTMAHQLLGDLYRKQRDYRRAIDQYRAAALLDPYGYKNQYDLAVTYQFLDRLEDAVAAYLQALRLSPMDMNSHMNLGLVYLALGRMDASLAQLKKATEISPDSSSAWCNYGVALDADAQWSKAERAYERALELNPDQPIALMNLGVNLLQQGEIREAEPVLALAARKLDTPAAHQRYGDVLVLEHRDSDALIQYRIALQRDPQYWPAMNQIGLILVRKYEAGMTLDEDLRLQAVSIWKQSLALRPDQPRIRQWVMKWDQGGKLVP